MQPRRVLLTGLVAAVALAACTGQEAQVSPTTPTMTATAPSTPTTAGEGTPTAVATSPSPTSTATSTDERAGLATPTPAAATGPASWEVIGGGFDAPVATLVDPRTDELLVVDLPGRIARLDGEVVLDLADRVTTGNERGLLDVTTTPDGSHLVVHYSGQDGATTLSLFELAGDPSSGLADPGAEQVLLTFDQPAGNHNGGSVVFGPDGMLYLALGDGGQGNDAFGFGDDPGHPLGAILRLDVTTRPGSLVVPDDNPFVGTDEGDDRVWAHGLRNPWRIATDGQRWFIADVGQDAVEEVSIVAADTGPHDLGWPEWEGDFCRVDTCETDSTQPVATFTHEDGVCSIIGGAIARVGPDAGRFFTTDLCDTRVWSVGPDGDLREDVALPGAAALGLDTDADGNVVALTGDGQVLRRTHG